MFFILTLSKYQVGHIVRGIDFTEDPLLQGRLYSYLDTQLNRNGGPNFEQIPINQVWEAVSLYTSLSNNEISLESLYIPISAMALVGNPRFYFFHVNYTKFSRPNVYPIEQRGLLSQHPEQWLSTTSQQDPGTGFLLISTSTHARTTSADSIIDFC